MNLNIYCSFSEEDRFLIENNSYKSILTIIYKLIEKLNNIFHEHLVNDHMELGVKEIEKLFGASDSFKHIVLLLKVCVDQFWKQLY
jgi:hypothetical protein